MNGVKGPNGPTDSRIGTATGGSGTPDRVDSPRDVRVDPHAQDAMEGGRPVATQPDTPRPGLRASRVSGGTMSAIAARGALQAALSERASLYDHPGVRSLAAAIARAGVGSYPEIVSHTLLAAMERGLGLEPEEEEMLTLDPTRGP